MFDRLPKIVLVAYPRRGLALIHPSSTLPAYKVLHVLAESML